MTECLMADFSIDADEAAGSATTVSFTTSLYLPNARKKDIKVS